MIIYYNGITKNNLIITINLRMWATTCLVELFNIYKYTNIEEIHLILQNNVFLKYYWFVFFNSYCFIIIST